MSDPNAMIDALEEAGHEPYSYSGRFMYGKRCVAVDMADSSGLLELGYALGLRGVDPSEFGQAKTDSMGRGIVIYWPYAEWPDDRQPVENDNGD